MKHPTPPATPSPLSPDPPEPRAPLDYSAYAAPFTHVRPATKRPGEGWMPFGEPRPLDQAFILNQPGDTLRVVGPDPASPAALILCNQWRTPTMPAPAFYYYVTLPPDQTTASSPPPPEPISQTISQDISAPQNPTPGCPSPLLAALLDPCMMPALEAYAASKNANAVRCLENARAAVANALDPSPLPARVIVIMDGGLIQNVLIADGEPAHVVVIDYDTEGAGDDETIPVPQAEPGETEPAIISHWSNPPKVNAEEPNGAFLLSLFGYRSPRNETRPA